MYFFQFFKFLFQPVYPDRLQEENDIRHFKIGVYDRPLTANGKLLQDNCSLVEDMGLGHGILKSNMN